MTELILENTLAKYTPEQVVALLSCFVFQDKTELDPAEVEKPLLEGQEEIEKIAKRVDEVQLAHKVGEESQLRFGLMPTVYAWAKGVVRTSIIVSQSA